MDERPSYYAVIPAKVRYDPDLKDKAKLLYAEISSLCNKSGECKATNNYFAKLYKVTPVTISRLIKQLKDKGYIRCLIKYKDNSKEVEERVIKIIDGGIIKNDKRGINKNDNRGINKNVNRGINKIVKEEYINNINNNTPYNPPIQDEVDDNDYLKKFELFWSLYPKKQKKEVVKKWFKKNNPDDELMQVILDSLEKFKQTTQWTKNDKQFIPHPSTWLNQKRWEDEIILENVNKEEKDVNSGYEVLK